MTRLSAEALGLRPEVYAALLWVRDAIDPAISDRDLPDWVVFDMREWGGPRCGSTASTACRTAACLGGSIQMYLAGFFNRPAGFKWRDRDYRDWCRAELTKSEELTLRALFYGYPIEGCSRERAVEAVDEFLSGNTSDPWCERPLRGGPST